MDKHFKIRLTVKVRSRLSCFQRRMDGWNHHHPGCHCCCHPLMQEVSLVVDCLVCFAAIVCSCWLKGSCCWPRGSFTINFPDFGRRFGGMSALFFLFILGALTVALLLTFCLSGFLFQFPLECYFGHGRMVRGCRWCCFLF